MPRQFKLRSPSHSQLQVHATRQRTLMADVNANELVDDECDLGLDSSWERVDTADGAKSSKGSSRVDACLVKAVQEQRPCSSSDFRYGPRRTLPHPCLQSADSQLLSDTAAWVCAGIAVLYVAWHFVPLLVAAWKAKNLPGGKPPCPLCWGHIVQLGDGKQLTVGQCYEQLPAAEVKKLQAEGKMGKTACHGWPRTPYRAAGIAKPELLMAYQYQCKGCPGGLCGSGVSQAAAWLAVYMNSHSCNCHLVMDMQA